MDPVTILELLGAAVDLVTKLAGAATTIKADLSTNDQATLDALYAQLHAITDTDGAALDAAMDADIAKG